MPDDPAEVVRAFYSAVNNQDYELAWRLGGKNLGRHPSFSSFADGFKNTITSDMTIESQTSETVTIHLNALESVDGKTQTSEYSATYVVREGEIVSGRQKLIARE
jgi:ketosteroid isomerase-like protein